jgi:ABC-2 type transport system permease protein/ribosome-dependent ATPase
MNLARVGALAWKEWREVVRDRIFLTLAFLVPALQLLVVGYGLSLDVEDIPVAILDEDRSALSRDYAHRFIDSEYFDFRGWLDRTDEAERLLVDTRVRAVVVIPPRFEERLRTGEPVAAQALIDGTYPFRADTTKAYVIAINAAFSRDLTLRALGQRTGAPLDRIEHLGPAITVETRYLYNQALESNWSITPGLMTLLLAIVPPLLTAVGVVREKESGSIYNIYSSTLTRLEFIAGKLAPYVVISIADALILWVLIMAVFGTPFKGSPTAFFVGCGLYVLCMTSLGMIVSLLVRTQIAAILITMIISLVPTVLYSGMLIPVSSLDVAGRIQARLIPGFYFNTISTDSFLKGVGAPSLWDDAGALAVFTALLIGSGWLLFRKRPAS